MNMIKFGAKPKTPSFEEFKKAALEYRKKNAKNTVKETA